MPHVQTHLVLFRSRYEQLTRPHLELVPELLLQVVQSAIGGPEELHAVVLAGGSARIPLVKQLVAERLEPPRVDVAPELVAACGAAVRAVDAVSTGADRTPPVAETSVLVRIEGTDSGEFLPGNEDG